MLLKVVCLRLYKIQCLLNDTKSKIEFLKSMLKLGNYKLASLIYRSVSYIVFWIDNHHPSFFPIAIAMNTSFLRNINSKQILILHYLAAFEAEM